MTDVLGHAGVLVVVGLLALGLAAWIGVRAVPPAADATAPPRLAPLVPWLGSLVAVVLAVRGSLPAATLVLASTVAYALAVRLWPSRRRR